MEYGPVFQGLVGVWERGDEVFAEVVLPGGGVGEGWWVWGCILLCWMLRFMRLGWVCLMLVWRGAGWFAVFLEWCEFGCVGCVCVAVCLTRRESGGVALLAVDEVGALVVSVESLVVRPVSAEMLARAGGAAQDPLLSVDWVGVSSVASVVGGEAEWVVLGSGEGPLIGVLGGSVSVFAGLESFVEAVDGGLVVPGVVFLDLAGGVDLGFAGGVGGGLPGVARGVVHGVLGVVQAWLGDERFESSRLVVVTRGAVAAGPGDGVEGLECGGVWGLVRSAQAESPGRLVLVDVDGGEASWGVVVGALGLEESQLAVRDGWSWCRVWGGWSPAGC